MKVAPQTIVAITARNIKRIKVARLKVGKDGLVLIGGRNEQGKSSLIDSIAMALGGKRLVPPKPVRSGSKKAEIKVELQDFIVKRTFDARTGGSTVSVTGKGGAAYKSPQKLLDEMTGDLTFDPLKFAGMEAAKQRSTLIELAGIGDDLIELDRNRAGIFEMRAEKNREKKILVGMLESTGEDWDEATPAEEIDRSEIMQRLKDAQAHNETQREAASNLSEARQESDKRVELQEVERARISELEQETRAIDQKILEAKGRIEASEELRIELETKIVKAEASIADEIDTDSIMLELEEVADKNALIMKRKTYEQAEKRIEELELEAEDLTDKIQEIDDSREGAISAANLPVDGLGFDEGGITLQGKPFEQASQAERIATSVAMGIALNPTIKILLIRDGSLLDDEHLKQIADMAEAAGVQVWVEWVTRSDADAERCAVVFEDGEVAGFNG